MLGFQQPLLVALDFVGDGVSLVEVDAGKDICSWVDRYDG